MPVFSWCPPLSRKPAGTSRELHRAPGQDHQYKLLAQLETGEEQGPTFMNAIATSSEKFQMPGKDGQCKCQVSLKVEKGEGLLKDKVLSQGKADNKDKEAPQAVTGQEPGVFTDVPEEYAWLPSFAYAERVHHFAKHKLQPEKPDQLSWGWTSSPTVPWLMLTLFLTLYKDILSYILASHTAVCRNQLAVLPRWLWFMFLPLFFPLMFAQFICLRYCFIPHLQLTKGRLGCFPQSTWGYCMFMTWHGLMSLLFQVDGVSDAFTAATQLHAITECHTDFAGSNMRNIWAVIMEHSWTFPWLKNVVPLEFWVWLTWIIPFVPLVCMLVLAMPRYETWDIVRKSLEQDIKEGDRKGLESREWLTLFGDAFCCGRMLTSFSDGLGMDCVSSIAIEYAMGKTREHRGNTDPKMFVYLKNSLVRCAHRLVGIGLLEMCFQMHVQLSMYAVARAKAKLYDRNASWDFWLFFSLHYMVGSNFVMAVFRMNDAMKHIFFAFEVMQGECPAERFEAKDLGKMGTDKEKEIHEKKLKEYQGDKAKSYAWRTVLVTCMILYFIGFVLAVLKFLAAFYCEYSVWNLSGCVDLGPLLASQR